MQYLLWWIGVNHSLFENSIWIRFLGSSVLITAGKVRVWIDVHLCWISWFVKFCLNCAWRVNFVKICAWNGIVTPPLPPSIRTAQSSPEQAARNSSASTEAAALPQLFRRPSYLQRQRYSSPYQRLSRRPTATTTSNRSSRTNNSRMGPGVAFKFSYQILSWTMCQEPARSCCYFSLAKWAWADFKLRNPIWARVGSNFFPCKVRESSLMLYFIVLFCGLVYFPSCLRSTHNISCPSFR